MDVGKVVRARRKARNLSQMRLAELSGISQSGVSRIERAVTSPTVDELDGLAKALKCTIADLVARPQRRSA